MEELNMKKVIDNKKEQVKERSESISNIAIQDITAIEEIMNNDESVKPLDMVTMIQTQFGKNTIIIKDNLVFRCSTKVVERGPKSLIDNYLPNYGKMTKLVITDKGLFELTSTETHQGHEFVQYTLSNEIPNINVDTSIFDQEPWNKSKVKKVNTK